MFTTHWKAVNDESRLRAMSGSAMLTMVASTNSRNVPRQMATKAHHFLTANSEVS